jgi:hypothetical protein
MSSPTAGLFGRGAGTADGPAQSSASADAATSQVPLEPLFESTRRSQLSQRPTAKPKDDLMVPSWLNDD